VAGVAGQFAADATCSMGAAPADWACGGFDQSAPTAALRAVALVPAALALAAIVPANRGRRGTAFALVAVAIVWLVALPFALS
jgi:hypothetical protein